MDLKNIHPLTKADEAPPSAVSADGSGRQTIGLLTTDVALVADPSYRAIVRQFAGDRDSFDSVFAHAWYKLTTRDMGPRQTCM